MASMMENLKKMKPLIETGMQVFMPKPELQVTDTMKKQRTEFLQQFPRGSGGKPAQTNNNNNTNNISTTALSTKSAEEECKLYRSMIAMYQNEMIAQAMLIEKLQQELKILHAKLESFESVQ